MAFLKAMNGPEAGTLYELTADECILGRHSDCTILIDVGAVSRHHSRVCLQSMQRRLDLPIRPFMRLVRRICF